MNTSKSDLAYLKKIRGKIKELLKIRPGKFEDEDYHQLRVEIKKLKAVAGFIEFSNKKFSKKKYLKPFTKIYKRAGKIREFQLEEAFLKTNNPQFIEQYLAGMAKRIEKEKKKFASIPLKKTRKKTRKAIRKIELFLLKTNEEDSIQFINKQRDEIATITREFPINPANAHKLRKILKKDFYNRKRIDLPSQKIKAEDDLLELLGSWHDCVVLNNQIGTSVLKAEINPAELAQLLKINTTVSSQSENLFGEINSTLEKGIF